MNPAYTLTENASLRERNGFRVPSRAELLVDIRKTDGLAELLSQPWFQTAPLLVLGEGSNTLIVGDVPGAVLTINRHERTILSHDDETLLIRVGAGEHWNDVVQWSLGIGASGLENLILIPGTAGAAPVQNIGAYGTEVGEFIENVEAWDRVQQQPVRLSSNECQFAYRDSVFKKDPSRWLILAVELRLPRHQPPRIDYPGLPQELAALGAGKTPRPSLIAEAIARLRLRKLPNPDLHPNLGSFFRNPVIARDHADAIRQEHSSVPVFPAGNTETAKLSAAWLIEQAGWKGYREGDAAVSGQHALVLVNHGQASGEQLLDLARRVAASVKDRFGVQLEPEVRLVGARF